MNLLKTNDHSKYEQCIESLDTQRSFNKGEDMYREADKFAGKMHEGQFREGVVNGKLVPYIEHPRAVSKLLEQKGFDYQYRITGLFHDLMEDTQASIKDMTNLGGSLVVEAVKLLTKPEKPEDYMQSEEVRKTYMSQYLEGIKSNQMALAVKLADRICNLTDAVRADSKFIAKYIKETEEYYIDLAKGTVFEIDMNEKLNDLIEHYNKIKD